MPTDPLTAIDVASAEIGVATAALNALAELRQAQQDSALSGLPPCDVPVTEHCRAHRMGPVPKIVNDPEVQASILARIDRLTYDQIAADIAAYFPPARHVHRATVHRWVQRWRRDQ